MKISIIATAFLSILVISCQKEAVISNSLKQNLDGITSSASKTSSSLKTENIKDINGNTYKVLSIGNQKWIASNLNTSKYRNGDPIPEVKDPAIWSQLTTGAWCYYKNDPANGLIYGKLYNWYAINDPRGLAPIGWHIPSGGEWDTLALHLGGLAVAGGKMKSTSNLWIAPNVGATNSSGFSALPGGYWASYGEFLLLGTDGWWTFNPNYNLGGFKNLTNVNAQINQRNSFGYYNYLLNQSGVSVRLVKN